MIISSSRKEPKDMANLIAWHIERETQDWRKLCSELAQEQDALYTGQVLTELSENNDLHESSERRNCLVEAGRMLGYSEGLVVSKILRHACLSIQSAAGRGTSRDRERGQMIRDWLIDEQRLGTRQDLGYDGNMGVVEVLVEIWEGATYLSRNPDINASRSMINDLLVAVLGPEPDTQARQNMGKALHSAAANLSENTTNEGLLLALLDQGAPWQETLDSPYVLTSTKNRVLNHPRTVRERLAELSCAKPELARRPAM